MDLPKNEKSFEFNHIGEITGKKYEGTFTVRCVLNAGQKRTLEIEKSALSADLSNPTGNLSALSTVIANLRVRIINAPDWFKQSIVSLDLLDEEVLFELYGKCLDKEGEWIKEVKGEALGEQKAENSPSNS